MSYYNPDFPQVQEKTYWRSENYLSLTKFWEKILQFLNKQRVNVIVAITDDTCYVVCSKSICKIDRNWRKVMIRMTSLQTLQGLKVIKNFILKCTILIWLGTSQSQHCCGTRCRLFMIKKAKQGEKQFFKSKVLCIIKSNKSILRPSWRTFELQEKLLSSKESTHPPLQTWNFSVLFFLRVTFAFGPTKSRLNSDLDSIRIQIQSGSRFNSDPDPDLDYHYTAWIIDRQKIAMNDRLTKNRFLPIWSP